MSDNARLVLSLPTSEGLKRVIDIDLYMLLLHQACVGEWPSPTGLKAELVMPSGERIELVRPAVCDNDE